MILAEAEKLLLRAALESPREALAHFARWRDIVDLNNVAGTDFRLLPLVYENIGVGLPDDALKSRLRGMARHAWLRNRARWQLCSAAIGRLRERDIPFMLIKGTALAILLGRLAELRALADCDVLVPVDRAGDALKLMLELGLSCPYLEADQLEPSDFTLIHGLGFTQPNNAIGLVDLHWRPLAEVDCDRLTDEFFEGSNPATLNGAGVRVPAPGHALLQAAVHGTKWAEPRRYDWMADCFILMRVAGDRIDWTKLWLTAERHGLAGILEDSLDVLSDTILLPIASCVWRRRVGRISSLERREARARQKHPADRSKSDWMLLDLRRIQRADAALSALAPEACMPALRDRLRIPGFPGAARSPHGRTDDKSPSLWFVSGWSHPEPTGRWTDGGLAVVAVRLPVDDPSPRLALRTLAIAPADRLAQSATVSANGRTLTRLRWPRGTKSIARDVLDLSEVDADDGYVLLRFQIADPHMPARLDRGGDYRRLGIFLISMSWLERTDSSADAVADETAPNTELAHFGGGWSFRERNGRWTDGEVAHLSVRMSAVEDATRVVLASLCIASPSHPVQSADVLVAERRVAELRWPLGPKKVHRHVLDLRRGDAVAGYARLRIRIAHPIVPARYGVSSDVRALGMFLMSISHVAPLRSIVERPIELKAGSPDRHLLMYGWDERSQDGCWTEGAAAALRWDGDLPSGAKIDVVVSRCLPHGAIELSGHVFLNDLHAGEFRFDQSTPTPTILRLERPTSASGAAGATTLRFEFDATHAPPSLGLSRDVRELGLLVRSIGLSAAAPGVE
jgi:hypothetical protein